MLIFLSRQVAQDAVLRVAGKTFADVMRVGVYLTDMKDLAQMNAVYALQFDSPRRV
jgi:enamine deaminase RidA (YjgF/YER057c/UK114 family)